MISYDTANHGFESVVNGRMNFKIDDTLILVSKKVAKEATSSSLLTES